MRLCVCVCLPWQMCRPSLRHICHGKHRVLCMCVCVLWRGRCVCGFRLLCIELEQSCVAWTYSH